ncbi:hypothetical protein [Kordia jejudonensis]|uniref:hypothetical protein n=1 Tax=Kordia jejudonensis TaxID=1348245 RepID=UPI00062933F4|nr:hypothetical protein [Kordia jejudonensis]
MKKILAIALLFSGTLMFAQTEKVVTSKTKKTTTMKNGEMINTKVKVITEKTKQVKFDKSQRYQLNQDRVPAQTAVTKIYMIDNDKDPAYDEITKVKYYTINNKKYAFKLNDNDLDISFFENDQEVNVGRAVQSKYNDYYVINSKEMSGVGYYTKDNDFVMEYYDTDSNEVKVLVFDNLKF